MNENIEHKNLSDAQVCFPKLKLIQISFCKKLKSLLPVAWARMLPQLSFLDISHADKLKVVFGKSSEEGTSNAQEIVIPNLEELKFIKLPSFVGFCPGFKLHAVNLVKMVVDECPKFAPIIDATQVVPQPCKQSGRCASANSQEISEEQEKNVIWTVKLMYLKQLQYLKYVGEEPTSVSLKNLICLQSVAVSCFAILQGHYSSAIQLLSKKDFVSSFFTIDEEVHDQDSLLNNTDNEEDDDGLLRLKLKEVVTYENGNNDNKKYDEGDRSGIMKYRSKQSTRGQIPVKPLQIVHAFDANYAEGATE
ncbi:hypothetical protein L6164_017129 [Bauhinia variegata]|uniref:Uncharacterized protein n=1 Tax=Bauhinia variegata TaxID=167791 RepID=A0ACB9N6W9_BAUVA|nr:hypothetical protein L6164_017129 [Bauhinia variegata]